MIDTQTKLKVGITVIGGIVLFALALAWLSDFKFKRERHWYRVSFVSVSQVKKGDQVTVLGVPKGRIQDVELYPESVVVKVLIDDYALREGATARLESQGIIGQTRLAVTLGTGDPLPDGTVIQGIAMGDLSEVISGLGQFLSVSDSVLTEALHLIGEVSGHLSATSSRLETTLDELADGMDSFKQGMERSVGRFETTGTTLEGLAAKLDTLSGSLLRGEGTAGKVLRDERLYHRADSTLKALKDLIEDVQENPSRYITVKVF
jgi:phospholipid/cholesterol/gamma-HCH transport system substrate-binding protein